MWLVEKSDGRADFHEKVYDWLVLCSGIFSKAKFQSF